MEKLFTFKDAPMFAKVMEDKALCKGVLESILGIEIDHIEYQNTEQALQPYLDARGVRLDAYVKSTGQVFDIEIQAAKDLRLDMRMRYYQSAIDATLIAKGADYDELDESFIIFICAYDAYGRGLPVYHVDRMCREDVGIPIDTAANWLVLNSTAWDKDDDKARSNLLQFVQKGTASDALTQGLAQAVRRANDDAEWRKNVMGFMTLEHDARVRERSARAEGLAEGMEQGKAEGKAEGLIEGEERMSALAAKMKEAGASPKDIVDAMLSANKEHLFEKYGL